MEQENTNHQSYQIKYFLIQTTSILLFAYQL